MKKIVVSILIFSGLAAANADNTARLPRVYAGAAHSAAVDSRGDLWCWGDNYYGQIGNGKRTKYGEDFRISENNNAYRPVKIMSNRACAAAGDGFTLALSDKGVLYGWGDGKTVPAEIMNNVSYVEAYGRAVMIIKTDSSLWIWKYGGSSGGPASAVKICDRAKAASLGENSLLILIRDDVLFVANPYSRNFEPVKIMSGVRAISSGHRQFYAVTEDGTLYAWGSNGAYGLTGAGSEDVIIKSPAYITDNVKRIIGKGGMLIKTDNSLWIWGRIPVFVEFRKAGGVVNSGIWGDLKTYDKSPVKILENITDAASGEYHYLAVKENGELLSWGDNEYGQLGNGFSTIVERSEAASEDGIDYDFRVPEHNNRNEKNPKFTGFNLNIQ